MTATIFFYILISISIGLYFSKRVKTRDDFIRAGRNLPFIIIFAMVFATWFGAETVLGISATFLEEGLKETYERHLARFVRLLLPEPDGKDT